jgi:phosphoserine phosphatase/dolichol kinase
MYYSFAKIDRKNNIMGSQVKSKVMVFDVDGVLYKNIFLMKLIRAKGLKNFLKILILGIKYYTNRITLNSLLIEGYKLAENFSVVEMQNIANKIKRVKKIKETVYTLHREGFYVALISAGIPNFILETLADEIGADSYTGLDLEIVNSTVKTRDIQIISKVRIVEDLLTRLNLTWDDTISIGDDPNNIELLKMSGTGIGFNPTEIVRENSDIVIESNDLSEILPFIIPPEHLPPKLKKGRYFWKRELFRKGVHSMGCVFPFIAVTNRMLATYILAGAIVIYFMSELFRYRGLYLLPFSFITKRAQRYTEKAGIITGPILLALGILISFHFFDFEVYLPAILIVSISDSLSALFGMRFGKTRMFNLKNRTFEGSAAFFISSLIILLLTVPVQIALPAAVIATALELIPMYNLDNLVITPGIALFLHFAVFFLK